MAEAVDLDQQGSLQGIRRSHPLTVATEKRRFCRSKLSNFVESLSWHSSARVKVRSVATHQSSAQSQDLLQLSLHQMSLFRSCNV